MPPTAKRCISNLDITKVEFIASVFKVEQVPKPDLPEIGFFGRSNVGKSTLINALLKKEIARSSSTPGKTQCLNYYRINERFYLVDAPGYGFAKTSKKLRDSWQKNLEQWLIEKKNLRLAALLIDAKIPAQNSDIQMAEFLRYHDIPTVVIANKVDKLKNSERTAKLDELQNHFAGLEFFPASGITKDGLGPIYKRMDFAVGG